MKAEDLRIGNIYKPTDNSIEKYKSVSVDDLKAWSMGAIYGQSIPLTEEWLEKFGARKINHIHGYVFWTFQKTKQNNCRVDIYERRTEANSGSVKHCEYLHQLQNLYFALTGEELILKP